MRRLVRVHAAAFAALGAPLGRAALPEAALSQEGTSCRALGDGRCGEASDHLLMQLGNRLAADEGRRRGPGDVGDSGCSGMPDRKRNCGHDGCLVLAGGMTGWSCDEYCHRSGRRCLGAWEDQDDTCHSIAVLQCHETYGTTSDLLCLCSSDVVGLSPGALHSPAWQLVWSDEFEGRTIDHSKWGFVRGGGGFGNNELQHYTARHNNARVQDGVLSITAQCEKYGGEHFTSAKLTTKHLASWGPGHRVDVRARLPNGQGTWPAIWMLPVDNTYGGWPHSGEIDIMEAVGCSADKVWGTVHTGTYNHMHDSQAYNHKTLSVTEWHTYSIQWWDHGLEWFIDEQLFASFSPSSHSSDKWPFDTQFYLILNLAVGGSWGGHCLSQGWPDCSSDAGFGKSQVMEVDFARVYSLKGFIPSAGPSLR
eukprot:CAMPEP_0115393064 /NCGR_PEP_ID=MMETSP0271-20121206/11551_1 /TAXON_ID=71861 /ORGANISM="Scrippsiella trochoidea, Strain CCMP3099" /LENGTH=420 /DNA_ID=CAMNT_0002816679 /DNA_START=57 /DNA_END=1319 /DNA_ORIENTATION=+